MTIKEITCYQTEDGKVWTTLKQAEFWEKIFAWNSKSGTTASSSSDQPKPEYNYRSQGEDDHIDRYAGRGL
jgi:hypothetical protein